MKLLTNNRRIIFLAIANAGRITKSQLCQYSIFRGGNINRIPHHLMGLHSEGYIDMSKIKSNDCLFSVSKKGAKMLALLPNKQMVNSN